MTRGTQRQTVRIDPDLWAAFGEEARKLDPPADRAELVRQYIRWFMREQGVKQPPRRRQGARPERPAGEQE
jgi:hypothetical protein